MRSAKRKSLVTMDDVASRASVSQTTVSYVLNGRTAGVNIPSETRQRVMDAARDLGYRRNQLARAMVTGKSRIIGVFTSPYEDEVVMRILAGALEAANNNDYLLKVMHLHFYGIDESTLARCAEWQVAGAMVVGISEDSQQRLDKVLQDVNMPLVMIDNSPPSHWGIHVNSDDDLGIRQVVTHLTELGHRQIGFLGGRPGTLSESRENIFRAILAQVGLEAQDRWMRMTSWGDQAIIEEGARALLQDSQDRPTAIVCSGDNIAMIVLRVAHSLGLRIPADLSVTGYSNANLSSFATPPLTTINQHFYAMGQAAVQYLVGCDDAANTSIKVAKAADVRLPTDLIVRASTGPVPT